MLFYIYIEAECDIDRGFECSIDTLTMSVLVHIMWYGCTLKMNKAEHKYNKCIQCTLKRELRTQ